MKGKKLTTHGPSLIPRELLLQKKPLQQHLLAFSMCIDGGVIAATASIV